MYKTRPLSGVLALVVSLIASLVLAELLLILVDPPATRYLEPPRSHAKRVWEETLHRASTIPGLAYEPVPSTEKSARGATMKINRHGMRDREREKQKSPGTLRIAVLGDSMTFGFGVEGDEVYSRVLEELLNAGPSAPQKYEVLNFGVGGYSTRDEAIVLRSKVVSWDPDLVVIGYVFNDPEIDPVQPLHRHYQDAEWWQYSRLLRGIAKLKRDWDMRLLGDGDYARYLHAHPRKWGSVVDAFRDIRETAQREGFEVAVVIWPWLLAEEWGSYPYHDIHRQVREAAEDSGFHVIEMLDAFSRYPTTVLRVSEDDDHANSLGHRLAAKAIQAALLLDYPQLLQARADQRPMKP